MDNGEKKRIEWQSRNQKTSATEGTESTEILAKTNEGMDSHDQQKSRLFTRTSKIHFFTRIFTKFKESER
jgi:hypothetical protein